MKALVKTKAEQGIWLQDMPEPECGNNDVIVKIHKTAICGTDIHIYNWDEWAQKTIPIPMITGHEYAGEIVEVGQNVTDLSVGDIVSGEGHITCGRCRNCLAGRIHLCPNTIGVGVNRTGAFAEYVAIPAKNIFKPSRPISTELLSVFDPYGNAVHTALSFNMVGEDVLITGAGPIGSMAALVADHAGARNIVITDMNQYRLDLIKKILPRVITINVSKEKISKSMMEKLGIFEGFDVGLEMSGSPQAFSGMLDLMINGGHIAMLAIMPSGSGIDWDMVVFKGSMMLQYGLPLEKIITHRFSYEDYQEGFETMRSGNSGKVILNWT